MTIPEVRARLMQIATLIAGEYGAVILASEIQSLVEELRRRKPVTHAGQRHRTITPALRQMIVVVHQNHPEWSQQEIAAHLEIGAGRVSETLAGERD